MRIVLWDVVTALDESVVGEGCVASVGEVDRAAACSASDPAPSQQGAGHCCADRAGEVVSLLGPVDAVEQRCAAVRIRLRQVGAEVEQVAASGGGQR
jgi:hypothetical protein